ncbi:M20/M25/M40 family metallo-hydrolase [Stackebrandtia nassauensis]|uniref:Peptidase M28 n=1 Tax=Stackebrandtia nassauensis (strain DSM 44728 / CIP 108903 / NRRL B-16338 / NBRC 102104 / LLR-40K-21) TaxID=446470 RepID=D3PY21_STANL|nr:M20/M25/M40 family metallo-hydrolase [Stackebrandtia nassauensis]ADD45350.1 peptidase M28 [Stackebrandtia nassauensis DSM 44728]
MSRTRSLLAIGVGLVTAVGLVFAAPALASPVQAEQSNKAAPDISVDNVKAHLQELQNIADANGGNRSAGTEGYTASADYVATKLTEAGFEVEKQTCESCTSPDPNIIADWPGGDEQATIMLGGHLDGVSAGPGINDNGSGSAALLEVALQLAEAKPELTKHVRFGWWADEEQGLNGSAYYVQNGGADGVEAYLNFDMIGSTNAGYFLDGDAKYTEALGAHLKELNIETENTGECCSDEMSFEDAGIPVAGLFTGAGAQMTAEQAEKWGGKAGESYDPCYHDSCDSYPDNINTEALDRMTDSIAVGLWQLAVSA